LQVRERALRTNEKKTGVRAHAHLKSSTTARTASPGSSPRILAPPLARGARENFGRVFPPLEREKSLAQPDQVPSWLRCC
jgi:hypothetical protein